MQTLYILPLIDPLRPGGCKSEVKMSAGVPLRAQGGLLLASLQLWSLTHHLDALWHELHHFRLCLHRHVAIFSLRVCVSVSQCLTGTPVIDLGPVCDLGFEHIFFGGTPFSWQQWMDGVGCFTCIMVSVVVRVCVFIISASLLKAGWSCFSLCSCSS